MSSINAPKGDQQDLGTMHAHEPASLYTRIPCTVGYSYIRFEVSGEVRPCCIAKYPIGNSARDSWRSIWRSSAYQAFRMKLGRIHRDRFHLQDPEFAFCLQCSHTQLNRTNAEILGIDARTEG